MRDPAGFSATSPWHEGEVAIQRSLGADERMAEIGPRVIRDHLVAQHAAFYAQLPSVVIGAVDPAGDAWASVISGRPGFLATPDPYTLTVSSARDPSDPADAGLEDGDAVGLLGIELHSRRRNRLNGRLRRRGPQGFAVEVQESFGNCPQYIRPRSARFARDPDSPAPGGVESFDRLDAPAKAMIAAADTLFIASYVDLPGRRQVDVSHRGGPRGFVRAEADGALMIPDYSGNRFFNTLGNIRANPKAGLVFVDFETGDLLQICGEAEVLLDDPAIAEFEGAERLVRLRPRTIVRRPGALPLRWSVGG